MENDNGVVPKISWKEIQLEKLIGSGSFGEVYAGKWKGNTVAIKQLFLKKLSNDLLKEFQDECSRLHRCRSPYIVQLFGVCVEEEHYAMVLEFLSKGSLYDILHDSADPLPWTPLRWKIAIKIARGLEYLHDTLKFVHSNLKSTNIVLDKRYSPKITDFGLSTSKLETTTTTFKGNSSVRWMAPELCMKKAKPTFASDVFSFGMILWELTSRKIPFADAADDAVVADWIVGGQTEKLEQSPELPKIFNSWIEQCWNSDPHKRPPIKSIAESLEKQAVKHFQMAAEEGLADAQFTLAYCYVDGRGVSKDAQQAVKYYQLAADQGHTDAQYNLALCFQNGEGVSKDEEQAVKYLQLAADQGHAEAQCNLGRCYANGAGVSKDEKQAVKYFQMAAAQGETSALYNLGVCYIRGLGGEQQAMKYFQMAADQGDAEAQYNLGICYRDGLGVPKDEQQAVKYSQMAANQGRADAQYNLGLFYENGEGVAKDEKQAVKYYQLAADQGHADAQYVLALCYQNGEGVSKDKQSSVKYFQLAADQGLSDAQYNLACCYATGVGISKDEQQAVKYSQLAADQGHADSQYNLGVCYQNGRGCPKDEQQAAKYFQLAADQGLADAQFILGVCYIRGEGLS